MTTPEIPDNDHHSANPAGADADLAAVDADPMAALLGGLDLGSLMETAQEMQQQMAEAQNALAATAAAGRSPALNELTGDGLPTLWERVERHRRAARTGPQCG